MLKLAERMVMSFCGGVTASAAHQWTTLSGSGAEDVRVMTRKSVDDPGRPPGIVLNAATSFWLPVPPKRVFDFLRDESSRSEARAHSIPNNFYLFNHERTRSRMHPVNRISVLLCSGTSSPMAALFKRWLTSPTAATMETASRFFVSM
jgi:homeobox-leucine zipper protein